MPMQSPPPWERPAPKRTSARTALSRDVIVETALKLLDRDGVPGMTMRRVAQELGTGPASLYAHVANLAELEELVHDRVVGEVALPEPDPARWQEQIKALLFDSIHTMRRHSGVARFSFGRVPTRENSLRLADRMLGMLLAGGVPAQSAAWAVDMLSLFITGAAYEEFVQLEEGQTEENAREWFERYGAYLAGLPTDQYPQLVKMAPFLVQGAGDERLEFGIDLLIDGLAATAKR